MRKFDAVYRKSHLCGTQKNGAARRFVFFFCGRGKVRRGYNRLLRDESFETSLTEQRCSVDLPFVTFCFVNSIVRPSGCNERIIVRISLSFQPSTARLE